MHEGDAIERWTAGRSIWSFILLTFPLSWTFWLASGVLARRGLGAYDFRWLLAQIGVFGPSLVALPLSGIVGKELRHNALRMVPALVLPLVTPGVLIAASAPLGITEFEPLPSVMTVVMCAAVILFFSPLNGRLAAPGTGERYARPGARWLVLSIIFFPGLFLLARLLGSPLGGSWALATSHSLVGGWGGTTLVSFSHNLLLGGPLGEEIGWRGYLLPKLLKRSRPLAASLVLGVVWGLWHLPVDLYGGFVLEGPAAVLIRIIFALPLTILFTWFYLQSKGSLLVALFLHTSINILPDLGFSQYNSSSVVFFMLTVIAAGLVSAFGSAFRSGSG